ncbi:class I SAM-dependent methyltransferase [Pseudoalteromonas luteoviolacea]|uniref:Methyltransferase domain-containing protein n=1 Tax=Pseudoalteromonas luteoviolacea H33 TaxID=1365251 RepID=A0A167C3I9_9GAMM|nr:class I SAM-dependent methyltransferase [Pseudoalteromonas luteoviolacea]KZN47196.1 hypothetical protein N476_23745 [Pseudoalteromonas luteoviolacea H33]KZN77188.1 hypothetical protein N477_12445 [Pseudoalteromonas luteoviolacea H33-S]MBQ4879341.1 class I SAM-dependent methyltransferase [Pseudoalteromonas luteoviolacea]MBQ4908401.1 class I SAM-dependent methyltransferase [Pseudoalteromonas luteoviolacea]
MSFCQNWDNLYRASQHMSIWPWSVVVAASLRHTQLRNADENFRVLEVGCGAGANFPFFLSYCKNVYGIDGSEFIINQLKSRFPDIADTLFTGDFTQPWPFENDFDLIVDRGASVHNPTASIEKYLKQAFERLKPGGILLVTDWFSTTHSDYDKAPVSIDKYTKTGYTSGSFAEVGNVNFFDEPLIRNLVSAFEIISLTHGCDEDIASGHKHACWNMILRKPQHEK